MKTTTLPTTKVNGSVSSDEQVAIIYSTINYSKFKLMANNRNINLLHVKRLIESFATLFLITPIIVNRNFEVIDGQHRLKACIESKLPVYYYVMDDYGIEEVTVLNTNQKNWQNVDYLRMYCAEGVEPYLQMNEFMDRFPDFQIQAAESLITLKSGRKSITFKGHKCKAKDFEEGKLRIPNLNKSHLIARKIYEFKPFYSGFYKPAFVSAVMPLIAGSKVYNHKEMLHKLSVVPNEYRIVDCNTVEAYRVLLENAYNHKRQRENKVSFRYE